MKTGPLAMLERRRCLMSSLGKRALPVVAVVVFVCACRGRSHDDHESARIEPVEECKQYQALVASCLHRDIAFAEQEQLLPKTEADRAQIRQICTDNLGRLKRACR